MRAAKIASYGTADANRASVVVEFDNGDGTTELVNLPPFSDDAAHVQLDLRILQYETIRDRARAALASPPPLNVVRDYAAVAPMQPSQQPVALLLEVQRRKFVADLKDTGIMDDAGTIDPTITNADVIAAVSAATVLSAKG